VPRWSRPGRWRCSSVSSNARAKRETPSCRVVELTDDIVDPAVRGKNFPLQYDGYKRTVDQVRTRYGGSEAVPRTPTDTMQLRVTRPAFIEGLRALKVSQGVKDYDVNRDATRQEMRAYVCGQFHVEYCFKGPEKRLVYPWANGLMVENILAYYDAEQFKDWTHKDTGAPVLKAQHPEFEMWNQGIHARSGVACADCHMPYRREGALKISDDHIRSPLLNVNRACQTCHRLSEDELKARVLTIQTPTFELRNRAMDALFALIGDIQAAAAAGRSDAALAKPRDFQRKAQFYLDFVEAKNSTGFHAPQEAARILGESIDFSRQGQVAVRDLK
jgi:nitrite reductase (cytochrome c-552)